MLHNLGAVHTIRDNNEDVNMSCACVCTVVHACGYFNELDVCIAPINVFVVRGKVLGSSVRVRVKTRFYDAACAVPATKNTIEAVECT
jgi:hypothetical protein